MDYSNVTLGEMLSSANDTIRRNAGSILKQLQRMKKKVHVESEEVKQPCHVCYGENIEGCAYCDVEGQ